METSRELSNDTTSRLRMLSHDLSNSLETILQASYLLGKVKLDADSKQWVDFIDNASQEAARINREIREVLRAQK
jgi:signal transduction histidine kinase